jgi:DNA-binding response OmpR family regulator
MSRGRLLIVEDSEPGAALLYEVFKAEGFEPVVRGDVMTGVAAAGELRPLAIFIDWQLPDGSGLDACRRIRERDARVPILMVTARSDEVSATRALDAGADDFVTKPIRTSELVARMEAIFRRVAAVDGRVTASRASAPGLAVRLGDVEFDNVARTVTVAGNPVSLGALEFSLLEYLVLNRGIAVSRDRILSEVYGYDAEIDTGRVDLLVRRLRGKLGKGSGRGDQIVLVPGFGYRLQAAGATA